MQAGPCDSRQFVSRVARDADGPFGSWAVARGQDIGTWHNRGIHDLGERNEFLAYFGIQQPMGHGC